MSWKRCLVFFAPLVMWCIASADPVPHQIERRALPVRAAAQSGTLFSALRPAQTGIEFVNSYDDPRMWGERYEAFAFGSIGTGVAIGDCDGDGRPDIYFAGKAAPGRLYRNLGDWRFEDVTEAAGLARIAHEWELGTAFADVDNDGDLDLFVCRGHASNLLYINRGDGTFSENATAAGLDLIDASVMGFFADYDRDGWLDLYVQTNLLDIRSAARGQRDRLYHNRRDGTFEDVTETARIFGQTQGHGSAWWDPDDDGWPDLYVGNDFATPDQLYFNRRDGVFVNVADIMVPCTPYFAMGMDVGDVDNDGRLDLFVADMHPTAREQYVSGMLNMQAKTAVDIPAAAAPQYMRNMLYLNTGTNRFQEAAILAGLGATDWTWSVRFEDLDEDGRVDLYATNGMFRDFLDADFLARVNQQDLAGRVRLVRAAPELREENIAFRNLGDLQFENVGEAWGLNYRGISFSTAFGDLDGDGDLDLVFSNYNEAPALYRNDSAGTHRVLLELRGVASNRFGIGARVRIESTAGVQVRAIASGRGYLSTSEPVAHFGLGENERIDRVTIQWPSGRLQVIENLKADHRYAITEPDHDVGTVPARPPAQFQDISSQASLSISMTGPAVNEFASQPLLPERQNTLGPSIAVADLNGDGMDDVIVGGLAGEPRQALLQVGTKHVPSDARNLSLASEVPDASILAFEADGDGRPDLLIAKGGVSRPRGDAGYQPRLLLGDGGSGFAYARDNALPEFPVSAGPLAAADFDRDGRLDVFVGGRVVPGDYGSTPRSALWRNLGGRFADVSESMAPGLKAVGLVQAALWSDVDQDGWIDLIVATHWGGVRCWRNREGQEFVDVSAEVGFTAAGSGWWNSIAAADFNGDGFVDYAVGNLGLNTRYQASPEQPIALLAGAFDAGGRKQLIECETVAGRLMPIRARDSLLAAMPSLRARVPSYHAHAQADAIELFGADRIAAARRWEVTEVQSGVFLSTGRPGAGRFSFRALPRLAQIAPVFGMVAGDFDGDGRADLYAVQNSHAAHPEIGRFSGGISQLLRGDGRGGFVCVDAQESGLVVSGEARGLAVKDFNLDGWPDFIVSRQDAPTLALLNWGMEGRRSVSIRLDAGRDNPNAIGARVTVVLDDGSTQTGEVYAGSGYMSQSTPAIFFGYPRGNSPREIRIVWPDGSRSVHDYPADAVNLRFAAPKRVAAN